MKNFKLPLTVKIFIGIFFVLIIINLIKDTIVGTTEFYNQSIGYKLEYNQLVQNQVTTWDNNYLAFREKSGIADFNKETFVEVTKIIMTARTDGQNLAWKWNQENQQIPYEEFTSFYKDLSAFVVMRFSENKVIEDTKQSIVKQQNSLLKTFPGIVYNYFLKIPLLKYQYGFISPDSKKLFNK